jgi:hypothetical protein
MQSLSKDTQYTAEKSWVVGIYCGKHYSGRIVDSRSTPDGRNAIFNIVLDAPIEVYGQKRDKVEHWTNTDSNLAWME